jgi:transcription elongation factor GreA
MGFLTLRGKKMEKIPMTPRGYSKMEEELKNLKGVERPQVIEAISKALELGDLSENAEYHSAKERQSFIEGRIKELESYLSLADIINPKKLKGDKIMFGAHVKLLDIDEGDEEAYQIVGQFESDISQGLIANNSPIAKALLGKSVGDEVDVRTPKGVRTYEILSVEYK